MGEDKGIEVITIDPDNLRRDLGSATVRGLIGQGYAIGPAFLHQETREGPANLKVLMAPPSGQGAETGSGTSRVVAALLTAILLTLWLLVFAVLGLLAAVVNA